MAKFIPREKLGKKARRALDAQRRAAWDFSPVTRKVESKKIYNRKKSAYACKDDFSISAFRLPHKYSVSDPFNYNTVINHFCDLSSDSTFSTSTYYLSSC